MISIGFIGIGKLGKDCAELMHDKGFNVTGYDLRKDISTHIKMADSLEDAVCGKDVVFVAIQTPHHENYDGRYPTSHLQPKDFDYHFVKDAIKEIDTL